MLLHKEANFRILVAWLKKLKWINHN